MNAVDTNILVYVRDPRDPEKQETASHVIEFLANPVLLWQVACEYVAASRKLELMGYGRHDAWRDITSLARVWPLRVPSDRVLSRARSLCGAHSLSVWDALLLAACAEGDVEILYTEDLQHGATIEGVQIINPFIMTP
jgi:predicted nucleic acid-binding protein